MPKIKNKYTGKVIEITDDQLKALKESNMPFELIEPSKPKKPEVLIESEKKIKEFLKPIESTVDKTQE